MLWYIFYMKCQPGGPDSQKQSSSACEVRRESTGCESKRQACAQEEKPSPKLSEPAVSSPMQQGDLPGLLGGSMESCRGIAWVGERK